MLSKLAPLSCYVASLYTVILSADHELGLYI